MKYLIISLVIFTLTSCSGANLKPWERGTLARADMQFDVDAITTAIDDHTYFSKEASSGGKSFAGGGCGCN